MDNSNNILSFTYEDLVWFLHEQYGKGRFHAAAIFREVYKNANIDFTKAKEFKNSPELARALSKSLNLNLSPIIAEKRQGSLSKFITRLSDGFNIESVIVPMENHMTICISSQAGCRMGCTFCETAQQGLNRNLTAQEIVEQVYRTKVLQKLDIRNIVFMGMGEPFDNFNNVIKAIKVINHDRGMAVAHRYITISTSGHVKGIYKLAKLNWPNIRLAVSLNASNDNVRSKLMPINNKYPM
ncbi:radical SAM protein, partial [Desulfobacterales bacterium HSG17]|nr:radical SAM protein [Desulfobacterales bacterium HSG17]